MGKWFALFGLGLLVLGSVIVAARTDGQAAAQPIGQEQAALVVPATPILSPTLIPSPTLDIQATQIVQQTSLTNAQAELARVNLAIEQTNLAIQESKEREAAAIAAAAQSEVDKSSNNLRIIEEQNKQLALSADLSKLDNEKLALDNQAIELEIRKVEAEAQARNGWLVLAGAVVLGVGMIVGGRYLSKAPRKTEPELYEMEPEPETQTVQIAHPEARAVYEHDIQITSSERAILRRAIVELGGILSRRRLNGENESKTIYFSEGRAEQILLELRTENANGVSLAVLGPNSVTLAMPQLYQWLGLPTPPSVKKSPETMENTAKTHPTPPHPGGAEQKRPEGEGGGEESKPAEPENPEVDDE
jgi:hypothetical protein